MTTHPRIFGQHNLILNDLKRTQRWVGIEEAWIWEELGEGRWILSKYVVYNTQRTNRAIETFKSTGLKLQGPRLTRCAVNVDMIGKVRRNEDRGPEGSAGI